MSLYLCVCVGGGLLFSLQATSVEFQVYPVTGDGWEVASPLANDFLLACVHVKWHCPLLLRTVNCNMIRETSTLLKNGLPAMQSKSEIACTDSSFFLSSALRQPRHVCQLSLSISLCIHLHSINTMYTVNDSCVVRGCDFVNKFAIASTVYVAQEVWIVNYGSSFLWFKFKHLLEHFYYTPLSFKKAWAK